MSIERDQSHAPLSPRQSRLRKASLILGTASLVVMLLCGCILPLGLILLGHFGHQGDAIIDNLLGFVALLGFLVSPQEKSPQEPLPPDNQ